MNRTMVLLTALVALFLVSAACELGVGIPTPVPDQVELSVLVRPADKGYVEIDGAVITSGIPVGFPVSKLSQTGFESSRVMISPPAQTYQHPPPHDLPPHAPPL